MPSLFQHTYPLYRSKSLEKLANDEKYAARWPNKEFRNWSLYDDYWYDCYMGTSPRSRTDKAPYSMWNYPYSSWLRYKNHLYDLPSIYPSGLRLPINMGIIPEENWNDFRNDLKMPT
ncbi:hypothetical protein ACH3XW_19515 [Acanthocheilonema viteae]